MANTAVDNGIIPPKTQGEEEMMIYVACPECEREGTPEIDSILAIECRGEFSLRGIITCLKDGHQRPITLQRGRVRELALDLPGGQSKQLHTSVPKDIHEDIKEAERSNYYQCYKACVTMCRRALQLGLIERGIADKPLEAMLKEGKRLQLLDDKTYSLATSIKGFGDIGAHRREVIEPEDANMVIHATVRMLNELFL